jgi:hypothetical protein
VLAKTRQLAEQVRVTAEGVHQQVLEARGLIAIARQHAERGRQLSLRGREEARAVERSIRWSLDTSHKAERPESGKRGD